MSNTVVTNLTIDARGAEEGSATYIRMMQASQAASDRVLDAERRLAEVREKATAGLVSNAASTGRAAQSWQRLQAAVDPTYHAMKRIEKATVDADIAVRRGITTQEEATRVLTALRAQVDGSAQAARDLAREQETAAREAARHASEIASLRASFDPAFASAQRMAKEIADLNRLETAGIEITGGYAAAHDRIKAKYDGSAEAARKLAEQQDALNRQDFANMAKVEAIIARTAQEAATLTRTYDPLIAAQERYNASVDQANRLARQSLISEETRRSAIEASRRELEKAGAPTGQFTSPLQRGLDHATTIRHSGGSARESAAAFEEDARAMEKLTASAVKLQATLNPLGAAYDRMNAEIREYNAMAEIGLISQGELALASNRSRDAFDQTAASLGPVNDKVRLTANQVQNLGYQTNDVVTMYLSGSSPFQIMATQAGQVIQALQDGPGGVRGSLVAIGSAIASLVTPTTVAIAGFAALAAGAIYFGLRGRETTVPLTDAMQAHKDAVGAVADAYGAAASKAASFQSAASGVSAFNVRQSRAQLELSARTSLRENFQPGLLSDVFGSSVYQQGLGESGRVITEVARQYEAFETPVLRLVEGLEKGTARADLFVDEIAKIANLDPANEELQKAAKRLVDMAGAAAEAQRQLQGLGTAFTRFAEQTRQFNDLAGGLGEFIPNRLTSEQQIEQTYQQMMRLAKTEADITRAQDLRRLALDGLTEAEARRRAGYELDVRAVTAKSAVDRAQIEYERTYADVLASTNDKEQAARQAREAQALSLAQSNRELTEAQDARIRSGQEQVEQLRQELTLFGQSAGAIAANEHATTALSQAREAARAAGTIVDPAEEAAIRSQAEEIGRLTDQLVRLNLERDQSEDIRRLSAEAGLIYANDDARRVLVAGLDAEAELRRQGIDLNDAWSRSYVQNARDMAEAENALDRQREAYDDLKDAVAGFFESMASGKGVLESFLGLGQKIASTFISQGIDKLLGVAPGAAGGNPLARLSAQVANGNAPAYTSGSVDQTFAAPLGRVERSVLPALSRTSERFAANSNDLAANIRLSADTLGVAARDIATVISFETGGSFDPWQKGPTTKWGQHRGLIQWGEPQRAQYGVTQMSTVAEQMQAVTKYLHNAGVRPGMGLLDIYSAVNAGRVGRYNASDTAAGGTWGTVADKVNHQMSGHALKADSLLNASPREVQRVFENGAARGTERGIERVAANSNVPTYSAPSAVGAASTGAGAGGAPTAPGGGFGGLMNLLRSPFGQGAMNAVGAFSAGASGGPISGALSGGLGAIGMGLGPLGIAAGVGAGLLGSLAKNLFNRKEREQQHRQLAAQWSQMLPQWREYQERMRDGVGPTSGLRAAFAADDAALDEFMRVGGQAWKYGTENSTALHWQVGANRYAYQDRTRAAFRDSFATTEGALAAGQGLEGPWIKARDAIRQASEAVLTFVDDTKVAFGESAPEVARAQAAGIEQLRSALRGAQALSQTQSDIQSLRGGAAALASELQKLGMSAVDAGRAVEEDLNVGLRQVAQNLNEGIRDRIEGLAGVGYFADVRSFLKEFDTLKADVTASGADPSQLQDLFGRELQAIVDGARVTGDAFTTLIGLFPQLAGVVREFTETAVEASASEIRDAIKGYEERLFAAQHVGNEIALFDRRAAQERLDAARFGGNAVLAHEAALAAERANIVKSAADAAREQAQSLATSRFDQALRARTEAEAALRQEYERTVDRLAGIRDFLRGMALDDSISTLSGEAQFLEAQRIYRETLFKANGGDVEAQDKLLGVSQDYLEEARAYYATSARYGEVYREIDATLKASASRIETELDVARQQASFLGEISAGQKGIAALLTDYLKSVQDVLTAMNGVNANRNWGTNESFNRSLVDALSKAGIHYTGAFGGGQYQSWLNTLSAADRAKAEGIGAGLSGSRPVTVPTTAGGARDWGVNVAANQGYVNSLAGVGLSYGGAFGSGGFQAWLGGLSASDRALAGSVLGFSHGGYTGGASPSDVRGVVHGQEFVFDAAATRAIGVPNLERMHRARAMPDVVFPRAPAGNDNAVVAALQAIRSENAELRREVKRLGTIIHASDAETRAEIKRGNRSAKKTADAAELDAA